MKQQVVVNLVLLVASFGHGASLAQDTDSVCSSTGDCSTIPPTKGHGALLQVQQGRLISALDPDVSLINASNIVNPSGASAPLTEDGYAAVADRCCQAEMEQFMERVAFDQGIEVCNKGGIWGLAPFHTCQKGPQTLDALKAQLLDAIADRCSPFARTGECSTIPEDCTPFESGDTPDCFCSSSKAAKLDFTRAYLGQNNLGGIGPDTGAQEMRYINIFAKPFPVRWTTHSEFCIDVAGGEYRNGANVATWTCVNDGTHFNMQWTLPPSGTGLIRWTPHPDKCFQVAGGSTANGANLELWDCDESNANQQFTIPTTASGQIKWATHPNKCVDVDGGKTGNRVNIQMWDCEVNNGNQQFTLPAVSDATDLVVTAVSAYTNPAGNGDVTSNMANGFGSLVVRWGTSTDFQFKFVQSGTSTAQVIPEVHFAFFDLDKADAGAEFIQGKGYKGYVTDIDTSLSASRSADGRTKFTGTVSVPNPTAPGTATADQRKASVMFFFENVSEFGATFGFEGTGPFNNPGQNALLLFSGSSVLTDRCAA